MTRLFAAAVLSIAAITILFIALSTNPIGEPHRGVIVSGRPLPDFTLISQNNESFSLGRVAGRPVILFFGYTGCPDICPLAMRKISESLRSMGPRSEDFAVIFITVDPLRDTPARLSSWVSQYYPKTIALTGDLKELGRVWRAYGAARLEDYESAVRSGDTYYVSHSAVIYVADRNHLLRNILTPEMDTETFRQVLEEVYRS